MFTILPLLILLLIIGILAGWFYGTWQTRLRLRTNRQVRWNENCHYYALWNPWHPNKTRHLLFTENELQSPINRAQRNPEDLQVPK